MKRQQISIGLESDLLEAVERYQNRQQVPPSRSRAIEALIRLGLQAADPQLGLALQLPKPSTSENPG